MDDEEGIKEVLTLLTHGGMAGSVLLSTVLRLAEESRIQNGLFCTQIMFSNNLYTKILFFFLLLLLLFLLL